MRMSPNIRLEGSTEFCLYWLLIQACLGNTGSKDIYAQWTAFFAVRYTSTSVLSGVELTAKESTWNGAPVMDPSELDYYVSLCDVAQYVGNSTIE